MEGKQNSVKTEKTLGENQLSFEFPLTPPSSDIPPVIEVQPENISETFYDDVSPDSPENKEKKFNQYHEWLVNIYHQSKMIFARSQDEENDKDLFKNTEKAYTLVQSIDQTLLQEMMNTKYKYFILNFYRDILDTAPQNDVGRVIKSEIRKKLVQCIIENPGVLSLEHFLTEGKAYIEGSVEEIREFKDKTLEAGVLLTQRTVETIRLNEILRKEDKKEEIEYIFQIQENNLKHLDARIIVKNSFIYASVLDYINTYGSETIKNTYVSTVMNMVENQPYSSTEYLINHDVPFIQDSAKRAAKILIEKKFEIANFDIKRWHESKENTFEKNMLKMESIESRSPGGVKKLYENYGIMEFNRYPADVLLNQLAEENKQQPYGVVVFPRSDHNGAFDQQVTNIYNLYLQTKNKYGLKIVECESKFDLARVFLNFEHQYGIHHKVSYLILGGHGSKENLILGGYDNELQNQILEKRNVIFSKDIHQEGFKKGFERFFEEDAEIIFLSCETGMEEGIAKQVADVSSKTVYAPKKSVCDITVQPSFDKNGKIHFKSVLYSTESEKREPGLTSVFGLKK